MLYKSLKKNSFTVMDKNMARIYEWLQNQCSIDSV
jgi:hypothetical protein